MGGGDAVNTPMNYLFWLAKMQSRIQWHTHPKFQLPMNLPAVKRGSDLRVFMCVEGCAIMYQ